MNRIRLAIIASHAIPYQAPLFAELAKCPALEVMVYFGNDYGVKPRASEWGVRDFVWDGGLVDEYPHHFLRNLAPFANPSTFFGKLNPGLIPAVRRFRPAAYLLTGYGSAYHLQGLFVALVLSRVPTLYLADSAESPRSGVKGTIKRIVLSRLYARIAAFMVIGTRNREHYRAFGVSDYKLFDCPYSVGNARFRLQAARLSAARSTLRKEFGVPDGFTCVVYVGRLAPEKNVAELVRGAAEAPNTFLLVVGSGPDQHGLEELAAELLPNRHRFAGFLNQARLGEVYAAADVLALPSLREKWGLVCNEAMNFGLPIVVSDQVGAGPDLVLPGETGFVYPSGSVSALAKALTRIRELLIHDPAALRGAVLRRIALFSEQKQARGVLRALGVPS